MPGLSVVPISHIELRFTSYSWPFAQQRRAAIDEHFAAETDKNPALWNGQVIMLREPAISEGVFRGACFVVDFASFLAWRDWGYPDDSVRDCFAQGALRAAGGEFLLGENAAHTANPGCIHFPGGMLDLNDVVGSTVDLDASMYREIAEETGLSKDELVADQRWYTVLDGPRIAHFKLLYADETVDALDTRMRAYLARDARPELADIRIARGPADVDPATLPATDAFMRYVWSLEGATRKPIAMKRYEE
jgi:8-oxo-dGTP pyrophosphatase MutT (NUDIX family)